MVMKLSAKSHHSMGFFTHAEVVYRLHLILSAFLVISFSVRDIVSHTTYKTRLLEVSTNDMQKISACYCHINIPGFCFCSLQQLQGFHKCQEWPIQRIEGDTFPSPQKEGPQLPKIRGLYIARTSQ